MPDTTPTTPAPFRYIDGDDFCLSARLLPDLNTGRPTDMVSITIEGSDEPQSAHVPVAELPQVLAGIATAAGLVLGATDQQPTTTSPAPLAAGLPLVKGCCPACGKSGLFLGDGGYVTCSLIGCPEPDAASTVLERGPADRTAVLREAADETDRAGGLYAGRGDHDRAGAAFALMETYRRLAVEAQQPRCTCGETACESDLCDCDEASCPVDHAADEAQQSAPTFGDIGRVIHTKHPDTEHCEYDGEPWPCRVIRVTTAVYEQPTPGADRPDTETEAAK